jgi:sortase A
MRSNVAVSAKALRAIERLALALGALAISSYVVMEVHQEISSRAALQSFRALQSSSALRAQNGDKKLLLPGPQEVSFLLWSEKRVFEYQKSLTKYFAPPLAVLRIPKIHVEVPVFDGTDDLTLNRGVGRIIGTSKPGQPGNMGIAGHRDGFFRGLKDVGVGDTVELVTVQETLRYVVDDVQLVQPDNVSVLADRGVPSLTLVTCYPFYFIGDAPQRRIFQCSLQEEVNKAVALKPRQ